MIDPLRPGAREAVAACHQAGITVCMITGDHPVTALAIARDLGLASSADQVVAGRELEGKALDELQHYIHKVRVFARVAPRQKLELVEAAQWAGHFVAVTGDGVNDAPALRAAHIGVAMGKGGTDVAREAAELVITDDNFATIVAGVEEGRVAYDNIRKVIYLLISTGAAEVLMVGLAVAAGLPLPLLPVQLLWLNLVTNGIQDVALAFEPSEGDVLRRRPRSPKERIFDRLMIERTIIGAAVMGLVGNGTSARLQTYPAQNPDAGPVRASFFCQKPPLRRDFLWKPGPSWPIIASVSRTFLGLSPRSYR
jgi:magnesium-transporting ATPase (P-type)